MTTHPPGQVLAHIRSVQPSLLPAEQAVAAALLEHAEQIVELSSQQLAELSGASRATVVRTCQSLGYSGYQQLRVLLARDAGYAEPLTKPAAVGPAGMVADTFAQVGRAVTAMTALLDEDAVVGTVKAAAIARHMLVVGNGLSAPLAQDMAARLSAIGRPAQAPLDVIGQQIAARLLGPGDVLLIISGSGANSSTLRVAQAALDAGALLAVITAFTRSPLAVMAHHSLVVGMGELSFRDEVTVTTRIPQTILMEGLIAALTEELGEKAAQAKALALEVISANLDE
ncbi:MurR/RpiR family transcriptional regulator [Arthrobacter cryoconiti]|uniref:MurR/RpiR family transcriptional regulator n=1 Tax=Arthrobacter cryoconiti TaxID=748907 RepID=A0ABV8QW33_9MICC|nr:MurR/RpiR family transcriptional regulator [Arthrobacter cryoconiti]MCC9068881.1 MurR/RpiR family transcriptional regulator [Arthrobacter cryoconiti]